MGLRLKSKLFMSAAFKLPSTMHYHIVEMTQPLIEDCPISMTSFEALSLDLENHPVTPIHQSRNIKGKFHLFLNLFSSFDLSYYFKSTHITVWTQRVKCN